MSDPRFASKPDEPRFSYTHVDPDNGNIRALSASELEEALQETQQLKKEAQCDFTRALLAKEEVALQTEKITREQLAAAPEASAPGSSSTRHVSIISKYAWDETDKFVSIYIDLPGVGNLPEGSVVSEFAKAAFSLSIRFEEKPCQELKMPNLCYEVETGKCKVVVKAERLVVKLKKAQVGQKWGALHDAERKKKEMRDERVQNGDLKGATTEELLKDMYDNADAEGKRSLREAMASGQAKRQNEGRT